MLRDVRRRAIAPLLAISRHPFRIAAVLFGLAAGACTHNGQPIGPLSVVRTTTIAIDSIEGPPAALASALEAKLKEAAEARQIEIVAREEQAQYRLRGYLTAHAERGKTSVAWVWDIYGPDARRAARVTGEEAGQNVAGTVSADAWAAADDRVLRKIAQSGIERVVTFVNSSDPFLPSFAVGDFPRGLASAQATAPTQLR